MIAGKRIFTRLWQGVAVTLLLVSNAYALALKPVKVAPNVYAFIGDMGARTYANEGMNANTGFIVTSDGVIVVDSGPTYLVAKAIHEAIQKVTKAPVKYVINTGGQDHRWIGNGYFKERGAEIIAQKRAVADMQERGPAQLAGLQSELKDKVKGTALVYPTRVFDKKDFLKLGGTEVQIIYFHGGHTPGDSVVWLPAQKVLFSGDLVYVDRLLGVMPYSNSGDWLASFDEMEKLKPAVIIPGHGNVCDLAKASKETKDYLVLLRTHMKKAVDNFVDLQAAIDSLDQSRFKYLLNYDSLKGGNASRVYLELEAK
jgi:glyoxylase-like metal-dependent hydrolase (beta-lactamase superfamily II)